METKARFIVDADHCQRAADELCEILRVQQRGFVERWHAARTTRAVIGIARWVGLIFSLLAAFLVAALLYFDTRDWATQPSVWSIPVFIVFFMVFVFLPRIITGLQRWSIGRADKRARRHANRCLSQARRLAPFEAEFDFRGDLLIYTRGKEGTWQFAWFRMLSKFRARGLAVQAGNVTAIFSRPRSLYPAAVILQRDRDWTGSILREAGVTLSPFPLPDQRNP